jgi:hypothetical protein
MLATLAQPRAMTILALAAVLAVIAVAMLALSAGHRTGARTAATAPGADATVALGPATHATPGSTARARQEYRTSLGR